MKSLLVLLSLLSSVAMADQALDCDHVITTNDINTCKAQEVAEAEQTMQTYLDASLERFAKDEVVVTAIHSAQQQWIAYRDAHCGAVYDLWREGTIRGAMLLGCKLRITHERTHALWRNYLTYMDSTPPLLPEPSPLPIKQY